MARTFSSVTFLPFFSFSRLNRPLSDGPIFFSSVSTLWQTEHCSKTSLPLVASPFFWAGASAANPRIITALTEETMNFRMFGLAPLLRHKLQVYNLGTQPATELRHP